MNHSLFSALWLEKIAVSLGEPLPSQSVSVCRSVLHEHVMGRVTVGNQEEPVDRGDDRLALRIDAGLDDCAVFRLGLPQHARSKALELRSVG